MFNRILLAIDDTPSGPAAVSFAIAMADAQASIHVVHVNELVVGGRGHTVETRCEASQVLSAAIQDIEAAGVPATSEGMTANPFNVAPRITEVAEEWLADVIVVGSRRRSRLGGLRGKGIRERITRLTSLPVMTAPPPLQVRRHGLRIPSDVVVARPPQRASLPS